VSFSQSTTSVLAGSPCGEVAGCSGACGTVAVDVTSLFRRRRKCGLVSTLSSRASRSFSSTSKRVELRFDPLDIASEKFFSKVVALPSSEGCTKSISAHRSSSLFCSGVPVSSSRDRVSSLRNALPTWHDGFLIWCPSSTITTSQGVLWSSDPSGAGAGACPSPSLGLSSSRTERLSWRLRFWGAAAVALARPAVRR